MYSLGIVMYRYLNQGVYPANRERIDRTPPDKKPFPLPRNGSRRLKALVLKATSYNPLDRFESPQAMLRELQQCDEYIKYIFDDSGSENATVDASAPVAKEIERLRRELAERENQIEQLKNQTVSEVQKKPVSKPQPPTYQPQPQQPAYQPVYQPAPTAPLYSDNRQRQFPKKPATQKTVKYTPLIVTAAVVLVIAMVSGIWALSNSTGSVKSLSELESVSVGDHFTFGNYPQGANGEEQPIEWRVLAVENGRALVISEKLLDCVPYNETYTDVTWETCTLREWMNHDFISKAFSSNEQAKITTVTIQNPDNPKYGTSGGNATQDKIFALSVDEADKYFGSDEDRMAAPTDYAKQQGCYVSDNYSLPNGENTGWWWLRSPGNDSGSAADVYFHGFIHQFGDNVNYIYVAVRPAFWLNL